MESVKFETDLVHDYNDDDDDDAERTRVVCCFDTAERQRPYLMTRVQGTNDYINAAFLDARINILLIRIC